MPMPKLMFMGDPVTLDLSDFMKKSIYDTNNDGVVDKLNKITDIKELSTGNFEDAIPKITADGDTEWQEDLSDSLDEVDGGLI